MRQPMTTPSAVLAAIQSDETGPTATLTVRRHGGAVIGHDHAGRETVRTMCEGPNFQGPSPQQLLDFVSAARAEGYAVKLR